MSLSIGIYRKYWYRRNKKPFIFSKVGSDITGTIQATLPALTQDIAGIVENVGVIDGTLPALTQDVSGLVENVGTVQGVLPV